MKICLIGFMGCGKSTLGKQLAESLKLEFIDLDSAFEEKYHMEITSFFNWFGEVKFRELETQLLESLLQKDDFVLSTGGGTPCFNNNMELIKKHALSVYIKLPFAILNERLIHTRKKRPIIQHINEDELLSFIENIVPKREEFYVQADIILNSDTFNVNKTSIIIQKKILEKLKIK